MNQSTRNVAVVVAALAVLAGAAWWSVARNATPAGRLLVAGDVRRDIRTVTAPAIVYPVPDYTVGIPKPAGTAASGPQKRGAAPVRSGQPTVSGMLTSVPVREGDHVKAGQIIAQFDTTLLNLGVEQSKTAASKAHKDVSVLSKTIDKLSTASGKLSSARAKIATAKTTLAKAKSALTKARKQLLAQQKKLLAAKAKRKQYEGILAALKAQAGTFPPGKVPPALRKQIADLRMLLASIDPGLAGIAKGLVTIDTSLAKVAKGAKALPKTSAQIAKAATQLADAKKQLHTAKDVLGIVANGQEIGVRLARARVLQASVRAPLDGTVTFARRGGTVAMVGAPLVRITADGPQRIDTYLTSEQVSMIRTGSAAEVTFDSAPKGTVLHGRISEIGSAFVFPPTSFPTQVVHMTRALKVTIKLDEGDVAPPGTPVDVSLNTN